MPRITELGARAVELFSNLSVETKTQSRTITAVLSVIAALTGALHLFQALRFEISGDIFRAIHLCLAITICYLLFLERRSRRSAAIIVLFSLLALSSIAAAIYIGAEYHELTTVRPYAPNRYDIVVGILLLALSLHVTTLIWGVTVPIIVALSLIYGYFGYLLTVELLFHGGITFNRLVGYTSIPYFRGLLGGLTGLSAGTIFVYILYAGFLTATGGLDFVMKLAFGLSGRSRAGPAQAAVIGSGFMGMISGSSVANVVSSGAFTIPLMKRSGYRPEFAGAVEAVASTGGQITPPVMGVSAFLIVGITGIPYKEIVLAAILPALIYYLYLMFSMHIRAAKFDLKPLSKDEDLGLGAVGQMSLGRACLENLHVPISVALLVYMLLTGMPAGYAAAVATLALAGLHVAKVLLTTRGLLNAVKEILRVWYRGLEDGARNGAQLAVIIAVISILVEIFVVTGFAQKLSYQMLALSGGKLVPLLALSALSCLAFGLGLPTSAAYVLVALLSAPALLELGVPLLASHLFVFYLANMSSITPPVAIAALVAANIAGASFQKTAFISVRLGLPGFLLPFLFVLHPEILGIGGTLVDQLVMTVAALLALIAFNAAFEGYLLAPMRWYERLLLLPAAGGLLHPAWEPTAVGMLLLAGVAGYQLLRRRLEKRAEDGAAVAETK